MYFWKVQTRKKPLKCHYFCHQKCSVCLFRGVPYRHMFTLHQDALFHYQIDEITSWSINMSMKWQADEMASWWNFKLMRFQVDEISSWWNFKLMKWQVDEMVRDEMESWWNGKLMK